MPKSIPTLCGSIMAEPFSLGVRIHTAAYRELGLDYTFVCFGVENPELAVQAIRTLGIRGMSVSMPYKSAVMPFLDELDPAARAIGAVNTIDNRNGRLTGYNTDFIGAVRALQEATDLNGQALAILGAGGAARAIAYGAQQAGAQVTLFNRSTERGRALAMDLGVNFGGSLRDFVATNFAILVNATSVGLSGSGAAIEQQEAVVAREDEPSHAGVSQESPRRAELLQGDLEDGRAHALLAGVVDLLAVDDDELGLLDRVRERGAVAAHDLL